MAVMDWYSRYVLSWEISVTLDTSFCLDALDRPLSKKNLLIGFSRGFSRWRWGRVELLTAAVLSRLTRGTVGWLRLGRGFFVYVYLWAVVLACWLSCK
jgi:hypothetical protein